MKLDVYAGTYTLPIKFGTGEILQGKGKGIYLFEFDTETNELKMKSVTDADNPSYLAINRDAGTLYAVNELKEYNGEPTGAVSAFYINCDGTLMLMGKLPTGGADPCHVTLSPDRKHLIVSNYSGGSVSVYDLDNGALGCMRQFIQYKGQSIDPVRQTGPHAHSAVFSKDANFVYICDLGCDRVRIYRCNDSDSPMNAGSMDYIASPGSGPRCAEFGADGRFCYVINELELTISVLAYNQKTGLLEEIQKVMTVPADTACRDTLGGDLHISPDGHFLYGSNRGLDNIAIYHIDNTTGMLSLVGFEPSGGRTPRSFTIDPTGRFLFCANQDSDTIAIFSVDVKTGRLQKKSEAFAPTPVCLTILQTTTQM